MIEYYKFHNSMNVSQSQFLVICTGYTFPDYVRIRDILFSSGLFSVIREDDAKGAENQQDHDADIILTGWCAPFEDISQQIHHFRNIHPQAAIIRCIPDGTPDPERSSLISLFDGYFLLDPSSPSWGDNLIGIICQAIKFRRHPNSSSEMSQDIYRQIFEKNPVPIALTIPETGVFVDVNNSFLQTYGYQREEVIGKRSFDLNIFESQEEREEVIFSCTEHHPTRDMEVRVRTKDNQIITCLFSADIIYDQGRKLYLSAVKNISEQKRIENELKDKNRFIEEILSNINEGIVVYDTDLRYQVWNRYLEILSGIPATNILGKPAHDFSPDFKGDNVPLLLERSLQGVTSTSADVSFYIPETGKTGWVSIIYTPYRDSSGTIIGVIGSVRDISERKYAEDEIIAHEMLLRSIIDTIPVWIASLDTEGKITHANTAFSSSLGLEPDMIEGLLFKEINLRSQFEHHYALIKKALSGREVPFNEEREDPKSGHNKKYLRGRYSPLRDKDGTVHGVVCVIIDITDLKIAQNTIESINSKLNLLSSITRHDILNSLVGVLGYLTFAGEEKDPERLHAYIKKAHQTALLIQEEIEFTRDYQDLGVKDPIWQNVHDVFTVATKNLHFGDILVETSLKDLRVYADPLLERVIYNLVDNALRYGKTVTRISSYWHQEADHIIWAIEDNGDGIAEGMKDRIFRKGVGHNTGLGLFLTREILDITGLSITETGTEGEGARFEILIPDGLWQKMKIHDNT